MISTQFHVKKIILGGSFYMRQTLTKIQMYLLNFPNHVETPDFRRII